MSRVDLLESQELPDSQQLPDSEQTEKTDETPFVSTGHLFYDFLATLYTPVFPPVLEGYTVGPPAETVWKWLNVAAAANHFAYKRHAKTYTAGIYKILPLSCCHENCGYRVDILTSKNNCSVAYNTKKLFRLNHNHVSSDLVEIKKTIELIEDCEKSRRKEREFHESPFLPPSTVYPSKETCLDEMDIWAEKRGFAYVQKPGAGEKGLKNPEKTTYTFKCAFDNCPHFVNVCEDRIDEDKHGWYVKKPAKVSAHSGHAICIEQPYRSERYNKDTRENMTPEEIEEALEQQEKVTSLAYQRRAALNGDFLPKPEIFDNHSLLEGYIDVFSGSYREPDGTQAPFRWKKVSSHLKTRPKKNGRVAKPKTPIKMPSVHYACQKKSAEGVPCPVTIIGGQRADGKWELRYPRKMEGHNH
ncbi:hypothetical protein CJU90_1610 [Yarrowia sp. C11]|nr:hypothetical protein CKK34_0334 [Yarrowia sp. E02]KAG5371571.1 hypothetical protein CJU90_1610 [Yarrowia sp. C11]